MREEGKELQKKIDETHQQLTSKLEESKKKLSQEATDALMKKLQKHSSQKANVEAVLAKLKSHREERPGPPSKNQLQAHMKQLYIADTPSSEQVKVSELQPTQELNVMFVADKNALLACAHIGDIITKPSFLSARFSVDIPSRIFTKRQATILIKAPIMLPDVSSKLSCQLSHHQDGNPVVCPVTSVGEGQFKVIIRSSTSSLHQLRVLVDGVDIHGSPFSVHVTEWGRQRLEQFATLDCPYGIAVTDDGQHVVITECEANCVTILDSGTGKVVRNFAGCENELKSPKSVTVSAENHIFMATSDSKVEKFSFSSSCEGSYDPTPEANLILGTSRRPVSIAISPVSGKVFCTNLGKPTECCITVLNADLTLSHSISGKGSSSEMGSIAIDSKGMLYVYDYNRGVVLKLTPEGKRLATIGSTGKQDYQFNNPVSICIDSDGIMYVANSEICQLKVFTTEGAYLGTLQHQTAVDNQSTVKASSKHQFSRPVYGRTIRQHRHGVAADKNGNVYVCDYVTGEVLVSRPSIIYPTF